MSHIAVSRDVVINVMFITLKRLSMVSERSANKDICGKTIDAGKLFISNYFWIIVWKLSLQGRSFFHITNYQGFRNNQVNLHDFFLLGPKFKQKFKLSLNLQL
jgi:hypothetical protein